MLTAIIVAGGSSRRMGFDKTFALLAGKPVIAHTIEAFEATEPVEEIILVGREDRLAELREMIAHQGFRKVSHVIAGGARRQDSVRAGLRRISGACGYIAVHDAARPLVRPVQIEAVLAAAQIHGAAALATPVTDTLKRAAEDGLVCASVEREGLFAMQTPQIVSRPLLERAYEVVADQQLSITDEISALEHLGQKALLVLNEEPNPKITFPRDLAQAEFLQARRQAGD